MCETLVDVTKQIVTDATEQISESEDAYQVRLEAHEVFARNALLRTEEIQNQFRLVVLLPPTTYSIVRTGSSTVSNLLLILRFSFLRFLLQNCS